MGYISGNKVFAFVITIMMIASGLAIMPISSGLSYQSSINQEPYSIYGYALQYNGTSAGGYAPVVLESATITVSWINTTTADISTKTTTSDAVGQYSVDIENYTDGGIVYCNVTNNPVFGNNGYNWTEINITTFPGGRQQDIVCGIPYEVVIISPMDNSYFQPGTPIQITYEIRDIDETLAPGYFTHGDGDMAFFSSDPLFINNAAHPYTWDGTSSATPGTYTGYVSMYSTGTQYINLTEGGYGESNPYLTPWWAFDIHHDGIIQPGWKDDWENITLSTTTQGFDWLLVNGWNYVSCPMDPLIKGSNGIFDAYDAMNLCYAMTNDSSMYIKDRIAGTNPSEYNIFFYGDNESSAFSMDSVHGYIIRTNVTGSHLIHFNATNYSAPDANEVFLFSGWNLLGFTHNYTPWNRVPRAKHFTDGTIDPDLNIDGPLTKIIVTEWIRESQYNNSYVNADSFPGLEKYNWYWDFSYSGQPGNAFWLWVETNLTLTFNEGLGMPLMNLTKTGPTTANSGEVITYTIYYSNDGDAGAYNTSITDIYPADVTFVSAVPAPTSGNNVWDLGTIMPGTSGFINITVQVNVDAFGTITNLVEAAFDNSTGSPQTPVNDMCSTTIIDPYMIISKTGPATANPGEIITYWINYSNIGTDWAYNVVITETYPAGVTFISSIPAPDLGNNIWLIGAIAPGGSGSIQITMQIDAGASGTLTNWAYLDYENAAGIPQPTVSDSAETIISVITGPVQNIDTGEYFNEIQAAINDADTLNGHTIEVSEGTYYENLNVNKSVTIIGQNRSTTIIDGSESGIVFYVPVDWVTIRNFTIKNGTMGIQITAADYCTIDNIVSEDHSNFGLFLAGSHHNVIQNCSSTRNTDGILIDGSNNNTIENNIVWNNEWGIYLDTSTSNIIKDNYIYLTNKSLSLVTNSNINIIKDNNLTDNEYGVTLDATCMNNYVYHNCFINNTLQAFDNNPGFNYWDNGYPSGGNYWSDYAGTDMFSGPGQDIPGSDGIGDTPYMFDFAQDNYPLWPQSINETSYSISLHNGWNLISFPLIPTDTAIENLLGSISGSWDVVKCYNPQDTADPWKTYRVGAATNDLAEIDNKMGFWLHVTNSTEDLIIYGTEPVTTNIILKAGWNLVSYPTLTSDMMANALWGTGADRVECYDAGSPYLISEMEPTDMMMPGNGYWVHVPVDSVWTVDY